MIETKKTAFGVRSGRLKAKSVLSWYLDMVRVRFPVTTLDTGLPILMVVNHPGWLDIEMSLFLVEELLGLDYYMMANIEMMEKRPFMRKHGVFGVDEHADAFAVGRALKYAATLLKGQENRCMVIFPQGTFTRSTKRPIQVKPGAAQIARLVKQITVLPTAIHYDLFFNKQPNAFVRIGEPINFRGDVPAARLLTETIRQRMEQELDTLQNDVHDITLDEYDIVLKNFPKYLLRR